MASGKQPKGINTSIVPEPELVTEGVVFESGGAPPPETEVLAQDPVFRADVFERPREDQYVEQLAPTFYRNLLSGLTFIPDALAKAAAWPMSLGAEALGFPETAAQLRNPATLGGFLHQGFEEVGEAAEALTGDRLGFDVTPSKATDTAEQAGMDIAALTGAGLTFAVNPAAWSRIMGDAGTRVMGSPYANNLLQKAIEKIFPAAGPVQPLTTNPGAVQAISNAATQYGKEYLKGLGTNPLTTLAKEGGLGFISGLGYSMPGYWADKNGQLNMNLGPDIGNVDVLPTLKLMGSMGLPVALSMTPTGIALGGGPQAKAFVGNVWKKATNLSKQLTAGMTEKGQRNLAARIFVDMSSNPAFLENTFLPAVRAGTFVSPKTTPPIRVLEDGTIIPATGGINVDTLQALRALGVDDLGLAAYELSLPGMSGKPDITQARAEEATRRKNIIDDTFQQMKTWLKTGDPAKTHEFLRQSLDKLETASVKTLDNALENAAKVMEQFSPVIGREDASLLARKMIAEALRASEAVERQLWSRDVIGTAEIGARSLGDWAQMIIDEAGRNRFQLPFRYFELAGKTRLNEMGIGETGKPLTAADIAGLRHSETGDPALAEEIGENGLFDVFGEAGPAQLTAKNVTVSEIQNYRSALQEKARILRKAGKFNDRKKIKDIVEEIDTNILIPEKFVPGKAVSKDFFSQQPEGSLGREDYLQGIEKHILEAVKTARAYTKSQAERFNQGPIGDLLSGKEPVDEKFLRSLMTSGPASGSSVEAFRNALTEPVKHVSTDADGNVEVSWFQPLEKTVALGDSPDVVEAELLHRFAESFTGEVTQKNIDTFLKHFGEAVHKVDGLAAKFDNLNAVQGAVDNVRWRLTNPSPEQVQEALEKGATLNDIMNARTILTDRLNKVQSNNAAAIYLDADPQTAARKFMATDPAKAEQHANELERLLAGDDTGDAKAGFRAGLFDVLYQDSRIINPETKLPEIGMDTKKYQAALDKYRPYLEKFFDKNQMSIVNELAAGGPLQEPGIRTMLGHNAPAGADVLEGTRGFGYKEGIGIVGRKAGEVAGRFIGLNPLVSIGMGRRISYYVFGQTGRAQIINYIEEAFRDPVQAAEMIERFQELRGAHQQQFETAAEAVEGLKEDPVSAVKGVAKPAADFMKRTGGKLKDYLSDSIAKSVRLGLIPAVREAEKVTLEEDYIKGPPFTYDENKRRYNLENQLEQRQSAAPPPKASRGPQLAALNLRPPQQGSLLDRVSPLLKGGGGMGAGATAPGTVERGKAAFGAMDPVFANQGGLVSLCGPNKPKQMVS